MKKFKTNILIIFFVLGAAAPGWTAVTYEDRDDDGDGYKESRVYSDNNEIVKVLVDSNKDKKYDSTFYFKKGVPNSAERDTNFDGKIDMWIQYDKNGEAIIVATDKHPDGKPDYWRFLKKGSIFKREFDRNFDGKADFRLLEENSHLIEKQYDDNYDGKYERKEKAPEKGSTGIVNVTNPQK
jgi:hypothetical protein